MKKNILLLTTIVFYSTFLQSAAKTVIATTLTDESLELKVNSGHSLSIPEGTEEYQPIPFSTFLEELIHKNPVLFTSLLVRSLKMPAGYQQLKIIVHTPEHNLGTAYTYTTTTPDLTSQVKPEQSLFAACQCSNKLLKLNREGYNAAYWISRYIAECQSLSYQERIKLANIVHVTRSGEALLSHEPTGNKFLVRYFDDPN